jgi:hypothetical protein
MAFQPIKTKEDLDRFVLSKLIPPAPPAILPDLKNKIMKPKVVK